MPEHIDVNAGKIMDSSFSIEDSGQKIYEKVLAVANGEPAAFERHKNQKFSICG